MKKKDRKTISQTTIKNLKAGNSVTILGINGLGKSDFVADLKNISRKQINFLEINVSDLVKASDIDFYRLLLAKAYEIVSIHTNELPDISTALSSKDPFTISLILKQIIIKILDETTVPLTIAITDISFLSDQEISFFNSIRSLRDADKSRVSFLFIDDSDLIKSLTQEKLGELFDLLYANIEWVPLPDKEKYNEIIRNCEKRFEYKLTNNQKVFVHDKTSGHAGLTKYLVAYLAENKVIPTDVSELVTYPGIKSRIERILDELESELYEELVKLANNNEIESKILFRRLERRHLISCKKNECDFTISLIKDYFEFYMIKPAISHKQTTPDVDIKTNDIKPNKELTQSEFDLFAKLEERKGEIVSREEVAGVLWGEHADIKYSDWAIDKLVSRLRKKLGDDAKKQVIIKTVKGRGFKLVS